MAGSPGNLPDSPRALPGLCSHWPSIIERAVSVAAIDEQAAEKSARPARNACAGVLFNLADKYYSVIPFGLVSMPMHRLSTRRSTKLRPSHGEKSPLSTHASRIGLQRGGTDV
jgi:hypothetical protein